MYLEICLKGYTCPIVTIDNVTTLKPIESWTETDLNMARWNSQGLNVI